MTDLIPIATFNISGVAMSVISGSDLYQSGGWDGSPACARAQQALVGAERRATGAGHTYIVRADLLAAGIIWAYCESVGSTFIRENDSDTRRDGRALLAVAERIEICCRKAGWGKPSRDHGPVPPEGSNPQLWSDGPPDLDAKVDAELDSFMAAAQKDILEALDKVTDTEGDLRRVKAAAPKLMEQVEARREAERRNAAGEVAEGRVAVASVWPLDAWGGEEKGWIVVEVEAPGGGDPVRWRRLVLAARAAARRRGFLPTPDNVEAIVEICRRVWRRGVEIRTNTRLESIDVLRGILPDEGHDEAASPRQGASDDVA